MIFSLVSLGLCLLFLLILDVTELREITRCLRDYISRTGNSLVRQLKRRDALRRQQQALCDVISRTLNQREYMDQYSLVREMEDVVAVTKFCLMLSLDFFSGR